MKKIFLFLLCVCGFALLQGEGVPDKVRRPARRIAVNPQSTLTVTPENTCVVIAKNAPSTVKFALKELNFFMEKIFGKPLSVVNAPVPGKNAIILGLNEFSAQAGHREGKVLANQIKHRITKHRHDDGPPLPVFQRFVGFHGSFIS